MGLKSLLAPLAASAVVVLPVSAFAQAPTWQLPAGAPRYSTTEAQYSYAEARRIAYDNGYREGLRKGAEDGRRNARYSYQDEREYQRADRGYNRSFGDRERYRQLFRDGFAAGYSEGYSRSQASYRGGPAWGGRPPYAQRGPSYGYGGYASPALQNGARDGYEKGLEDARKNRSFDPRRHKWYREGDRHYNSRYGPREAYKDLYRRGFQEGYERGYREGRYRW